MRSLLTLLLILLLSGCSLINKPDVSVQHIIPTSADKSGVDLEVALQVTNPNSFGLHLQSYSYNLQVASLPFSSGGNQTSILFPSRETTVVRIPLRVHYTHLLELLKRQPDSSGIPYSISASLNIESPLGKHTVPVHHQGTFSIPEAYRPGHILKRLQDLFNPT